MAQLIKLQDYVSRYELDLTRYSNQFVRLKQQRWQEKKAEQGMTTPSSDRNLTIVKNEFFNELFLNQLRWASSTPYEKSLLAPRYESDSLLRQLLQQLPDTHLLLYDPVFQIDQAPIELEAVLITPLMVYCLSFLKGQNDDIFQASRDRFWNVWRDEKQTKVISPFLSLQRSKTIVSKLTNKLLPIKQIIIASNGYVDHFQALPNVECHDKRTFQQWIQSQVTYAPMKSSQIKVARQLLDNTRTEYYERIEDESSLNSTISWEIDENI